jgi:tetratricopeptide (TPR) repeat protein
MTGTRISRALAFAAMTLALLAFAAPAQAQGSVKGKVVDAQNKPVEGATITIQEAGGQNRKFTVKSDRRGEFLQIGVAPGKYSVQADKDKLAQAFDISVAPGEAKEVNFTLKPAAAAEDAVKKREAIQAKYTQAGALAKEGKHDDALKLMNEIVAELPNCPECYVTIGVINERKKDTDAAEAAYKKAIELKPDSAAPYQALAGLYNAQQKFKEAAQMSAEASKRLAADPAGGGASAASSFNQGVIAWNASDFEGAKNHFEAAAKADANYADPHFMLGRVYLNLGKFPESMAAFQTYLKIAPTGKDAKEAQSSIDQLKAIIKK